MPILASDIFLMLSTASGSAGNSLPSTGAASLGKYLATTEAPATISDVFGDISGGDNAASVVDYRCLFVKNTHGSLSLLGAGVYMTEQVAGGATVTIGPDPTAASALDSASAQAVEIALRTDVPAGVTFTGLALTYSTRIDLGDIPAGYAKAFWVRRAAANNAALASDAVTLHVVGDTT